MMIEEEYIELIQRRIDGELTESEEEKLQAYLADNADARKMDAGLREVSNALAGIEILDAPRTLKGRIMNLVEARSAVESISSSPLSGLLDSFAALFSIRYAYSFSAGAIAGIFILAVIYQFNGGLSGIGDSDMRGTMVPSAAPKFEIVDSGKISLDGVEGEIQVFATRNVTMAEIHINSVSEIQISIGFEPSDYRFDGYRASGKTGATATTESTITVEGGIIQLSHIGQGSHVLLFSGLGRSSSPIVVKILSNNDIYEATFSTAK